MMTIIVYFLLLVSFYVITSVLLHKIRNLPPSPFPRVPIIGHLHLLKKPLHRALSAISDRHGPVLLLHLGLRRVLLVASASAAEECLTRNDVAFANRPRLLAGKHLGYNYTSLSWAPYGHHWRNLRRISSIELLSTHRLQMMSHARSNEVKLMISKLVHHQKPRPVDMKALFFDLTLNVMMMTIAGKRYCGENVEESNEFRELVVETFRFGGASNMGDFLPPFNWIGGTERKLIQLQKRREKFMQALVEDKRRTASPDSSGVGERRKTMIEVLLSLQQSEPEHYTDTIIRSIIVVLLIAGTDTSAGTMEWAMSLLLNHPQVLKKAQNEIDSCVGHQRLVEESDLHNLPYLHCIINETMRMCPAGPLLVPHESLEECTVGGYRVPGNTMLLINLWAIQNDPKTWEEPTKFKPERFQGVAGVRDGFKFMPFGSGRRSCPGEGLAVRMVGLALGSLLQCFDWERVGKEMVDMTEGPGLTLPKARSLEALCRPRQAMGDLLSQI